MMERISEKETTSAPQKIRELVEQFDRDQDIYKSKNFNETQLRTIFINPFFEALGWDMHPKGSPDKWEVVEEDQIEVNGQLINPDYYINNFSTPMRGGFYKYETRFIKNLPIRTIDFSYPADVARHDSLVALVSSMLYLHKRLASATGEHERTLLHRQIEAADRQIDRLVYELYDLTEEEIGIVEAAAK
ncbi:MAG: hypothetical protein WCG94_00635 [Methanothrix sp.]